MAENGEDGCTSQIESHNSGRTEVKKPLDGKIALNYASTKDIAALLKLDGELKEYRGQCHCGTVKFMCAAPRNLTVWKCNCSICFMKQNHHFVVSEHAFTLLCGEDQLSEYNFGSGVARHLFCKFCGVQSFYKPRSNPNGYGITLYCLSPFSQVECYTPSEFDGQNWEEFYAGAGSNIKKFSREL